MMQDKSTRVSSATLTTLLGAALGLLLATDAAAQVWYGQLRDGSPVQIDPYTKRMMVLRGGTPYPLWDGIHYLSDGTTVSVQAGVAVPRGTLAAPPPPPRRPDALTGVCEQLVSKVCGPAGQCGDTEACDYGRQLQSLNRDEQSEWRALRGNTYPLTPSQCAEALQDEDLFEPCRRPPPGAGPTACEHLVAKVCGPASECASAQACEPAQQLLQQEREEAVSGATGGSSLQCSQALLDQDFFAACTALGPSP